MVDRHYSKELELELFDELKESPFITFNIIVDDQDIDIFLKSVFIGADNFHITFCLEQVDRSFDFENQLKRHSNRLHFFFPVKHSGPTPHEVESFKARYPWLKVNPVVTGVIYNFEWSNFQDRNPTVGVEVERRSIDSRVKPLISIIIPVFDHVTELGLTLNQISKQTLCNDFFEVLIIEDGSNDSSEEMVREFSGSFPLINLSYVYLNRPRPRSMGDNCWRSMVARNYGASMSRSNILLFLDSDTLINNDFLDELITAHKGHDVIQACRYHLTKEATRLVVDDPQLIDKDFRELKKKTCTRSNNYFEDFQENTVDWSSLEHGWRYASTFCFSVKKELFVTYGSFSKSYCFYGFDDVELGYRMFKGGERFHLLKQDVYALRHEERRSEYMNDADKKEALFLSSAKLFYFQNLGSDIFEALKPFYESEHGMNGKKRTSENHDIS